MLRVFLLLVVVFLHGDVVHCACENVHALSNVSAFVRADQNSRGRHVFNGNFYLLDRFAYVDIYKANVTDLCEGIVKNFLRLESLSMVNVNLSKIEPAAFQNVPKLKELSLAVNKLTEIRKDSFQNLQSLEILYLTSNEISFIEENAFAGLRNLTTVHLDRNRLTEIPGNAFQDCPMLKLVDFKFNLITAIERDNFKDLPKSHSVTIFLNRNNVVNVDHQAFSDLASVNLHLEGNQMFLMSNLFHGLKEGSRLFLNDNKIVCVADDVVETMRNTNKSLYVLNNPIDCNCLGRIEETLGWEVYGRGEFKYSSLFPCETTIRLNSK